MDWKGSPPVFFAVGEEMLSDEGAVVAQRMARQGVTVVWEQYEAMPHCFALIFEKSAGTAICFGAWAEFCKDVTEGKGNIKTQGTFFEAKTLKQREVDVTKLIDFDDSEVLRLMKELQEKRIRLMSKDPAQAVPKL
jgi:hypothetical protein